LIAAELKKGVNSTKAYLLTSKLFESQEEGGLTHPKRNRRKPLGTGRKGGGKHRQKGEFKHQKTLQFRKGSEGGKCGKNDHLQPRTALHGKRSSLSIGPKQEVALADWDTGQKKKKF